MPRVQEGDTVRVAYTGRFRDGGTFEIIDEEHPLEFTIGKGEMIPGFEKALEGMQPGDEKTIIIIPDDAYGAYSDELVIEVDRSEFGDDIIPDIGEQINYTDGRGISIPATVKGQSDHGITLDTNHPLAGKELTYEIKLLDIIDR
ncbi:MAG: FKBP-type peptidyl-prolyl cis-trans isomerase [Bacteroidota bacterium]